MSDWRDKYPPGTKLRYAATYLKGTIHEGRRAVVVADCMCTERPCTRHGFIKRSQMLFAWYGVNEPDMGDPERPWVVGFNENHFIAGDVLIDEPTIEEDPI